MEFMEDALGLGVQVGSTVGECCDFLPAAHASINESGLLWFHCLLFVIIIQNRRILHLAEIPCNGAVELEQI
jgi:hypothetical protein